MAYAVPWDLLGLVVSGDIGEYTLYQDRYRRVTAFPKSPPEMPATPAQVTQRGCFSEAVANWKEATDQVKQAYEQISLRASLMMTGHNLWVKLSFSQDQNGLDTLIQQTGVFAPLPPQPCKHTPPSSSSSSSSSSA